MLMKEDDTVCRNRERCPLNNPGEPRTDEREKNMKNSSSSSNVVFIVCGV